MKHKTFTSELNPQIRATVIQDSVWDTSDIGQERQFLFTRDAPKQYRVVTLELEYGRYIHAEFMTHRAFSRNAASTRAIPLKKKIKQVWDEPFIPVHWGANQPGMQAAKELSGWRRSLAQSLWKIASKAACVIARGFDAVGLHKQVAGRILEPFEVYKVVMSTTELDNFFWLRDHPDAQPEIRELANVMKQAIEHSQPFKLNPRKDEYHVPYVNRSRDENGVLLYHVSGGLVDLDTAVKVSTSCCAQVSYRALDTSIDKAKKIFERLIESTPVHSSPTEHQATPLSHLDHWQRYKKTDDTGDFDWWSGNFRGWYQQRQFVPNNVK